MKIEEANEIKFLYEEWDTTQRFIYFERFKKLYDKAVLTIIRDIIKKKENE
jgi:hypothetical protein